MPIANLDTYKTVAVRVHSTAFASQGRAMQLESATLDSLSKKCGFTVMPRGATAADVMVDLNITNAGRGSSGWISSDTTATIDALLVLTDGTNGELLGTARIHGSSSGSISGVPSEGEAIGVVARSIVDLLGKSGCAGPRVAKAAPVVEPPKPDAPDESHRAEADALNDQGKEKLYANDAPGALSLFQQASAKLPDARYEFNVCLTFGVQERWDDAISSCKRARAMSPQTELAARIDHKLELLTHRQ